MLCFYGGTLKCTVPGKCDSVAIFRSVRAECSDPVACSMGMHVTLCWHNWFRSMLLGGVAGGQNGHAPSPWCVTFGAPTQSWEPHTRLGYNKWSSCFAYFILSECHALFNLMRIKVLPLQVTPDNLHSAGLVTFQMFLVAEAIWISWQQEVGGKKRSNSRLKLGTGLKALELQPLLVGGLLCPIQRWFYRNHRKRAMPESSNCFFAWERRLPGFRVHAAQWLPLTMDGTASEPLRTAKIEHTNYFLSNKA